MSAARTERFTCCAYPRGFRLCSARRVLSLLPSWVLGALREGGERLFISRAYGGVGQGGCGLDEVGEGLLYALLACFGF